MTSKTINCVIIDDEVAAIEYLSELVNKTEGLNLVSCFTNPLEALTILQDPQILVFLDIDMSEISGINFTKLISNRVIFITAHPEYAFESFEYQKTIDYILKPVYEERFLRAINKVQNFFKQETFVPNEDFLTLKSTEQSISIDYGSIDYIQALGHNSIIFSNGERVIAPLTLRDIEGMLPSDGFVRIHKSYVINKHKYIDKDLREVMLLGGIYLPLGKAYRDNV